MRTYLERKLADGTTLVEHYEYDRVVATTHVERLPSGRKVSRYRAADGRLISETHEYGEFLGFGISTEFRDGKPAEETYFHKRRMVSRKAYEKARVNYPDMPPSSPGATDLVGESQAELAAFRREQRRQPEQHVPDPARGAALDAFCAELLRKGDVRDARELLQDPKARLGVKDRRASRALLETLERKGATRVWACDIQTEVDGACGTSHLVVELPTDVDPRAALLACVGRNARKQGLDGDPDDGQSRVYMKLD
jgi:hypothetical protein